MLHIIRERATGWLVKVVLWTLVFAFIGTIFLVWGYGRDSREKPIAKVGGMAITQAEHRRYYENMMKRFREIGGGSLTPDQIKQFHLERAALESLVLERLELMASREAGFEVTDDEMKAEIENNKGFQKDGRFSKEVYFAVLRQNSLTPRDFENILRRDIAVQKITQLVTDSVQVTDQEMKDEFIRRGERVKIKYLTVTPDSVISSVKGGDKELEDYFNKNSYMFAVPEERKIEVTAADPAAYTKNLTADEAQVRKYYESHKAEFTLEESVHARHILFKLDQKASPAETDAVKAKAEALLKQVKAGGDFASFAKKHSADPGSAPNGGDLGVFTRGKMVPEFETAAFNMKAGEVSGLVRSQFGFHIIKVEEHQQGGPMKYGDAAKVIGERMVRALGAESAKKEIAGILADRSGKPFVELAKGLSVKVSNYSAKSGELIAGLANSEKLVKRVFELKKGEVAGPIDAGVIYAVRLDEIIPAGKRDFAAAKGDVEKAFKKDESRRLATERAEALLGRAQKGDPLATVAKEFGLTVNETPFLVRNSPIEGVPQSNPLVNSAFSLKDGSYGKMMIGESEFIFTVSERKAADLADLEKEKAGIRDALLAKKRDRAKRAWQTGLMDDAKKKGILKVERQFD